MSSSYRNAIASLPLHGLHRCLPREDDDEAVQAARAEHERVRQTLRALRQVAIPDGHGDKWRLVTLLRAEAAGLNPEQCQMLARMAWTWRRRLAPDLRPRANPDDPIVRALAAQEQAHG